MCREVVVGFLAVAMLSWSGCGASQPSPRTDAGIHLDAGLVTPPVAADVAAGEAIARARGCVTCHSSSAGVMAGSSDGLGGQPIYAPNVTPDVDTGVGGWTDADLINAIRFGVDDEGATLCSEMPRAPDLSDADAAKLVAWLRSLMPASNTTPESTCTPSRVDLALHGKLVALEGSCADCHGPALTGVDHAIPGTAAFAPNLTPDLDTGLGSWTTQQISDAVKLGVDDEGATLCAEMPRFDSFSDDELLALSTYLQSLTPVSHAVAPSACGPPVDAGQQPIDAGTTSVDASTPTLDAGTTSVDAGQPTLDAGTTSCAGAEVVLAQVYGAGGNSGALLKADFIELHNRTGHAVSLDGWALQYASASGSTWAATPLPAGTSIAPGAFLTFTVSLNGSTGAAVSNATALTPVLNLSSTSGKVALTNTDVALTGACPTGGALVDFLGYGTATCSEGARASGALSSTTAAFRKDSATACVDSDVNAADFVTATPAPHQGTSLCGCP